MTEIQSRKLFSNKMAVTPVLFWVTLIVTVIGSNASGQFSILFAPESLSFSGSSKVLESSLKEIFSASLGLSVEENSRWNGLQIVDPFNAPEAVVEIYIDGVSSIADTANLKSKNYPVVVDEYEPDTYNVIKHRIHQRFMDGGNNLVSIKLSDPDELTAHKDVFGEMKVPKVKKAVYKHLKSTLDEDYMFLSELEALYAIIDKVKSGVIRVDYVLDFYSFRFTSLHALSDYYGPNSLQAKEAKELLGAALYELSDVFVKAYDGAVLVTAVTTDVAHTRRAVRSIRVTTAKDVEYSKDYAAIFNIILWFGVVFAFSLIAIIYALMDMDPGRDSIIYRMTSTRMKKDN